MDVQDSERESDGIISEDCCRSGIISAGADPQIR